MLLLHSSALSQSGAGPPRAPLRGAGPPNPEPGPTFRMAQNFGEGPTPLKQKNRGPNLTLYCLIQTVMVMVL